MNHKLKLPVCCLIFKNRDVKEMGEELKIILGMRTQLSVQLIIVIEMSQVSKLLNGHEGKSRNIFLWKGQRCFEWGHYFLSPKLRELKKL